MRVKAWRAAAGINAALKDPNVRVLLEEQALQPVEPMPPRQIAGLIEKDTARYAKVIQNANIRINE